MRRVERSRDDDDIDVPGSDAAEGASPPMGTRPYWLCAGRRMKRQVVSALKHWQR